MKKCAAKAEAKARGDKHYLGKPCKHGHSGWRRVSSGICLECSRSHSDKANKSDRVITWREHNATGLRKAKFNYYLEWKYGITPEEYHSMLIDQDSCCVVCGVHADLATFGRLCVDHCHSTGRVRGLLCSPCNTSLGHLRESEEITRNLLLYIQERCK